MALSGVPRSPERWNALVALSHKRLWTVGCSSEVGFLVAAAGGVWQAEEPQGAGAKAVRKSVSRGVEVANGDRSRY